MDCSDCIHRVIDPVEKTDVQCRGFISASPDVGDIYTKITVKLSECAIDRDANPRLIKGYVQLTFDRDDSLTYGDVVNFKTKLSLPRQYTNPGGFNYRKFLLNKGVGAIGFLKTMRNISVEGVKNGLWFDLRRWIENLRSEVRALIERFGTNDDKQILKALFIGDKMGLSDELQNVFIRTGVMHVLVISGLHVSFVTIAIFFFIKKMISLLPYVALRFNVLKMTSFLTIFAVIFYVLFVGAQTATVRSGVMVVAYLISIIIDRRGDIYNTLALAVCLILIYSPLAIFEISFQLSFMSVLAIIWLAPILERKIIRYEWRDTLLKRIAVQPIQMTIISVVALIGVGPIIAYNFQRVALIGIFANLTAIPISGVFIVPLGFVVFIIYFVLPSVAIAMFPILVWFSKVFYLSTLMFDKYAAALNWTCSPTIAEMALFYLGVLFVVNWPKFDYKKVSTACMSFLVVSSVFYYQVGPMLDKKLQITFLDVGQGDCIFLQFPNEKTMLIDGGGVRWGSFDLGKNVVAPFLRRQKIKKIDYIINTHPHHDHYKGLSFIIQNFSPEKIWINAYEAPEEEFEAWVAFKKVVSESGAQIEIANEETPSFEEGGAKFEFLWPPSQILTDVEVNDTSIVNRITFKNFSFLTTGDLSDVGESEVAYKYNELHANILKVGHHGAYNSANDFFLEKVKPEYGIIQVGADNDYGTPHYSLLTRLEDYKIKVLRTDTNGAITIVTDGDKMEVKTEK